MPEGCQPKAWRLETLTSWGCTSGQRGGRGAGPWSSGSEPAPLTSTRGPCCPPPGLQRQPACGVWKGAAPSLGPSHLLRVDAGRDHEPACPLA